MKTPKPPRITEKRVGLLCDNLATQMGWEVQRYEQSRATMITEGLPDRRYIHHPTGRRAWVELKAPDGKLTHAQHVWLAVELSNGTPAAVVCSPEGLGVVLNAIVHDHHPIDLCCEILVGFAERGYRPTPPKRPRRARMPR